MFASEISNRCLWDFARIGDFQELICKTEVHFYCYENKNLVAGFGFIILIFSM